MKSFKLTLKRVIGCQVLRVDEYQTLLYESAAMLNSRPLTALDSQPDDGVYLLAPGHFLHQTSASVLTSDESPQRASPTPRDGIGSNLLHCLWKR